MKIAFALFVVMMGAVVCAEAQPASQMLDIKGTWRGEAKNKMGTVPVTVTITDVAPDGTITGVHTGRSGSTPIVDGKLRGNILSYKTASISVTYTVTGDQMTGQTSGGTISSDVVLSRAK